ncbi:carbohydrate-binding module family 48 protein [Sodiomyces alcalophilus JCM 7366]|uniref:carbohydrate-binding module family 48 protein n=1 Tax=Sodiomyces alcalophilus JCM 7366 TaxID=591952 RepID=UPI0039B611C4
MAASFKFTWNHPAEEVYVTGTFDNWTKSEKLDKVGDTFQKTVILPDTSKKLYYKFVVDHNWTTDHTAPQEPDEEGNINNFLTPEQITMQDPAVTIMNSVGPDSTTAELAKDIPLENGNSKDEAKAEESKEEPKEEEAQPTPVGAPGTFPETPAEELDKPVSINPLPATDVTQPPVVLAPGEPIPPSLQSGDINAQVTLDKESYEKSDRLPGLTDENSTLPATTEGATVIPESSLPAVTVASEASKEESVEKSAEEPAEKAEVPETVKESQEKAGAAPEASAQPTEVAEKAAVEEELKEAVTEAPSTAEGTSGFGTEKSETLGIAATAATAGGIAAAAAVAATGALAEKAEPAIEQVTEAVNQATTAATEAATKLPDSVTEKLPGSVQEVIHTQKQEDIRQEVAPQVPTQAKDSLVDAAQSPEAAGNAVAVEEKKEVEQELLEEVKPVPVVGEEQPASEEIKENIRQEVAPEVPTPVKDSFVEAEKSPEAAGSTAVVEEKKQVEEELLKEVEPTAAADEPQPKAEVAEEAKQEATQEVAPDVPPEAKASILAASASPEAAASAAAVEEKKEVEEELLKDVKPVAAVGEEQESKAEQVKEESKQTETLKEALAEGPAEEPVAAAQASQPAEAAPKAEAAAAPTEAPQEESAQVPAAQVPAAQVPAATNGTATEESAKPATGEKKKKNRLSAFFGKLKSKVSHKE